MAQPTEAEKAKMKASGQFVKEMCDNPECRTPLLVTYIARVGNKELHLCSVACRTKMTGEDPKYKQRKASPVEETTRRSGHRVSHKDVDSGELLSAKTLIVELLKKNQRTQYRISAVATALPQFDSSVVRAAIQEMRAAGQMERRKRILYLIETPVAKGVQTGGTKKKSKAVDDAE